MVSRSTTHVVVTTVLGLLLLTSTVAAAVSIDTTSEYRGGQEGQSQAVEMTYTLSPNENAIADVRLQFRSTDNSFIDFTSFERTINPGDADVNIRNTDEGVFEIDELKPNQEVTLTFTAYPKRIKQRQLDMAVVNLEYVQQGQSLSESTVISADLSSSPWFQLQDENGGGGAGALALLLVLIVGVGIGGIAIHFAKDYL